MFLCFIYFQVMIELIICNIYSIKYNSDYNWLVIYFIIVESDLRWDDLQNRQLIVYKWVNWLP